MERLTDVIQNEPLVKHLFHIMALVISQVGQRKADSDKGPILGDNIPHTLLEFLNPHYKL